MLPAPEDGRNYYPKHAELIEIINKIIIVATIWLFILLYQMMHSYTNIKFHHVRPSFPSVWNNWAPNGWIFMKLDT